MFENSSHFLFSSRFSLMVPAIIIVLCIYIYICILYLFDYYVCLSGTVRASIENAITPPVPYKHFSAFFPSDPAPPVAKRHWMIRAYTIQNASGDLTAIIWFCHRLCHRYEFIYIYIHTLVLGESFSWDVVNLFSIKSKTF